MKKQVIRRYWLWGMAVIILLGCFALLPGQVSAAIAGDFTITLTEGGNPNPSDYEFDITNNILTVKSSEKMTIANTNSTLATTHRIVIAKGITANITLAVVNIDVSNIDDHCALEVEPNPGEAATTLNLTLAEGSINTLQSGKNRAGLEVTTGAALVIDGEGSLFGYSDGFGAGLGGGEDGAGGIITINGGTITAGSSKKEDGNGFGAGIGGGGSNTGGVGGAGGEITINGGTVTACSSEIFDGYGAGIGGGGTISDNEGGAGGEITITGGDVTACSAQNKQGVGAGIGGGVNAAGGKITISQGGVVPTKVVAYSSQKHEGNGAGIGGGSGGGSGEIVINGGDVTAYSSQALLGNGAGIGNGLFDDDDTSNGGTITIQDGSVTAYSSEKGAGMGAGIGSGRLLSNKRVTGITINIEGGTVTACSSKEDFAWGAGIGGGIKSTGGVITIDGGEVSACSSEENAGMGAGIGGGDTCDGGDITIGGGKVTACASKTGDGRGAGIGGGSHSTGGKIQIIDGEIMAYSSQGGEGYGAGIGGGYAGAGETITIEGGTVTAFSSAAKLAWGAGIGGGLTGDGGIITINDGKVMACSSQESDGYGAGIGGGFTGNGGTININDGEVTAYSSQKNVGRGAGIGGGSTTADDIGGAGGTITITKGKVIAVSTAADGIGAGSTNLVPGATNIAYKGGSVDAKSVYRKALSVSPTLPADFLWKIDEHPTVPYYFNAVKAYHWADNQSEKFTAFRDQIDDPPEIDTQPKGFTCLQNETGRSLTVTLKEATGSPTYQWTVDKDDGKGFVAIEGAIEATYNVPTDTVATWSYKVLIAITTKNNEQAEIHSDTATVTVNPVYNISGKVINKDDNLGLSGVEVQLTESLKATTDANGDFMITGVPKGSYTLTAIATGYEDGIQKLDVTDNIDDVKVTLEKLTYILDGYVKDKDSGEPLEGADVTLNPVAIAGGLFKTVSAANEQTVQTDANGYYAFTNVEAGSYTIAVGAEGYERTTSEVFEVPGTLSLDLVLAKKADPTPQPDPMPDPKPSPSPTVKSGRSINTGDETPIAFLFVASAVALGGIWVLAKGRRMKP